MTKLPTIKKLPEDLILKIAAGEVVNSPTALLKELIENSLDAGSSKIKISLENGGCSLIKIEDDGLGINEEDFDLLCERFATSKISKIEDLESVQSFGFRGEALSAISQVSYLTVFSKTDENEFGFIAEFNNGKLKGKPKRKSKERGTSMEIRELFYNFPLRKAKLKPKSIHKSLIELIVKYSIAFEEIEFSFYNKEKNFQNFTSKAFKTRKEIVSSFFGIGNLKSSLVEIFAKNEEKDIKLKAIISFPYIKFKKEFIFFVNGRLVYNERMKRMALSCYDIVGDGKVSPFIFVSLTINERDLDPNVHPAKEHVEFENEDKVFNFICLKIKEGVKKNLDAKMFAKSSEQVKVSKTFSPMPFKFKEQTDVFKVRKNPPKLESFVYSPKKRKLSFDKNNYKKNSEIERKESNSKRNFFKGTNFVGLFNEKYAIIQRNEDLVSVRMDSLIKELFKQNTIKISYIPQRLDLDLDLNEILLNHFNTPECLYEEGVDEPKEEIIEFLIRAIEDNAKILEELFYIKIENKKLVEWPNFCEELFDSKLLYFPFFEIGLHLSENEDSFGIEDIIGDYYYKSFMKILKKDEKEGSNIFEHCILPMTDEIIGKFEFETNSWIFEDDNVKILTSVKKLFTAFERV